MTNAKTSSEQNIGEMRSKIEKLKSERRATEIAPRSHSEALDLVDQHVDRMGQANAGSAHKINVERFMGPTFQPGMLPVATFSSIESALCRVLPGPMAEFLRAELTAHLVGRAKGISGATRAKTRARLDREIRDLEISEEALILRMEADGAEVDRRGDMSPSVFLEITSEHEAA